METGGRYVTLSLDDSPISILNYFYFKTSESNVGITLLQI
jgi:hypothetical protein